MRSTHRRNTGALGEPTLVYRRPRRLTFGAHPDHLRASSAARACFRLTAQGSHTKLLQLTVRKPEWAGAQGGEGDTMPSLPELMPTQVSDEPFGGVTYHIAADLVSVLSVDVTQMPVYFEHHILLWKNSTITIGLKSLKGALKRMMAGMQIFVTEASERASSPSAATGPAMPIHLRRGEESPGARTSVTSPPPATSLHSTMRGLGDNAVWPERLLHRPFSRR